MLVRLASLSGGECNACAQALVQDMVLKRKQALLLSKRALWDRQTPDGPFSARARLPRLSGGEYGACAQALVQDMVLKRKPAPVAAVKEDGAVERMTADSRAMSQQHLLPPA